MPYCVKCGVELNDSTRQCPLCQTAVALPGRHLESAAENNPEQQRETVIDTFDKRLWIQVVSVLMAIPALICVVINVVFSVESSWSLYVLASLGTVWIWCISPFLYRRNIIPLWIATDAAALLGLLYVIDILSPNPGWVLPLALPIVLSLTALVLMIMELARWRAIQELHIVSAILLAVSMLAMVVETAVDLYVTDALKLQWSLLVLVSCIPLAVVAAMLQRRRGIVEGMKMWFRM